MTVEVGDTAPDFELRDASGQPVRLSDYRDKKHVVVTFYPLAFSSTCTAELCGIRDNIEPFSNDEVETLAISIDSPFTHRAFAESQGHTFPHLADFWPHGEVARSYGVFDERLGVALRATFLVDKEGIVRHKVVNPISDPRDHEAIRSVVAELTSG